VNGKFIGEAGTAPPPPKIPGKSVISPNIAPKLEWVSTYSLKRFDHNGLTLVVHRYGRGAEIEFPSGPDATATSQPLTFLLVHGIGVSPRYFGRLTKELQAHGVVYAVELPGFGSTPRPSRHVSIEEFAALLSAFARSWQLENPVLVGHSMGTQIVTEMAVQNPALSDRVVLMGSVVDPKAPSAARQGFRLLRDMLREPPKANWIVVTDYLRCGPRWYLTELPAMLGYPIEERLPLLQAETLIVRGERDPVAPKEWSDRIADLVSRPTRLDVPGAAHVVQHAASALVAAAIVEHARVAVADPGFPPRREHEG
jgi:pimeloyl-ACP methyl ester carboxylesterase